MLENRPLTRFDSLTIEPGLSLPLDCHGVTLAGPDRSVNQDDFLLAPLGPVGPVPAYLFAVADGIGGGPAGDRPSSLAIQVLHDFMRRTASQPDVVSRIDPA